MGNWPCQTNVIPLCGKSVIFGDESHCVDIIYLDLRASDFVPGDTQTQEYTLDKIKLAYCKQPRGSDHSCKMAADRESSSTREEGS